METKRRYVQKLALSGGPGGGKTKLAKFIARKAALKGYVPLIVPEVATVLMDSGMSPHGGRAQLLAFQHAVIRETVLRERLGEETLMAGGHEKPLLICDRGMPDMRAYVSDDEYRAIIREHGIAHHAYARDACYDAVVYMRTAALGAEKHYSNRSNKFRSEDLEAARALDRRTLDAWIGHQHLAVIGNTYRSFRGKLEAGWRKTCQLLGIPLPREIEKRYLVEPIDFSVLGIPYRAVDLEQVYLALPGSTEGVRRVRSWGEDGHATYTFTTKRDVAPGEVEEIEERISEMVFAHYTKYQDASTVIVKKRRTCFVYNDQYFMYDEFLSGRPGLTMLEIEIESRTSAVVLPPFVNVLKDVTYDREYSSRAIAGTI